MSCVAPLLLVVVATPNLVTQDPTNEPAIRANAVVVSGVLPTAPMTRGSRVLPESPRPDMATLLRTLVLGDGGLGPAREGAPETSSGQPVEGSSRRQRGRSRSLPRRSARGDVTTRGGVRVRAKLAGVKLDFPSRGELLIAPDGSVHLRDGGHTLSAPRGVEVWLMDGTRIVAIPGSGRDDPLESVELHGSGRIPGTARLLWRGRSRAASAARSRTRLGLCYLALGNGEVLYQATSLGPMLVLRRVLCPGRLARAYPVDRLVVLGDLLARSLQALPDVVPPRPVQFPQAPEAAARLAALSERWFQPGALLRPAAAAAGAMVFPLDANFRLTVEDVGLRGVVLAVRHAEAAVPVVEWLVSMRTELNLVRPDGGLHGGPRYFMRGLDLSRAIRSSWPVRPTSRALAEARDALKRLGARPIDPSTAGG